MTERKETDRNSPEQLLPPNLPAPPEDLHDCSIEEMLERAKAAMLSSVRPPPAWILAMDLRVSVAGAELLLEELEDDGYIQDSDHGPMWTPWAIDDRAERLKDLGKRHGTDPARQTPRTPGG